MADHRTTARRRCCPVIELRRYALHAGRREDLIDLFDREFVEPQETTGMTVIGQFRDLDDPDAFVWLRGFPDMRARAASLEAFYGGPVWRAHRDAANATMVSSDDVRLLRPSRPGGAFPLGPRNASGASPVAPRPDVVLVTIYTLRPDAVADFGAFFTRVVQPRLTASGALPVARLETEPAPNNFPRLPVREGERVFVWLARFDGSVALQHHLSALETDARWVREVGPALGRRLLSPAIRWRLTPTSRSRRFEDGRRDYDLRRRY